MVINHHHQLVGKQAIGPFNDNVAHVIGDILALFPLPAISKTGYAFGYEQSPGPGRAVAGNAMAAGTGIRAFAVQAKPAVFNRVTGNFLAGAGTAVYQPAFF